MREIRKSGSMRGCRKRAFARRACVLLYAASLQRLLEPAHRTGPSWREAAILSDAGLRRTCLRPAVLPSLRGGSTVLPMPPKQEQIISLPAARRQFLFRALEVE